jgi:hypothetical protein
MTTDRPTLRRMDWGKVADVTARALATFRAQDPEGWEGFLQLVDERGGFHHEVRLLEDGMVELVVSGMVVGRVPFAAIERDEPGAPRRVLQ